MTLASERGRLRARIGLAVCALALCWAPAAAQEVNGQSRTLARDLAVQGAVAFEQRDFEQALDRFDRAAQLFPAPSISIMQARVLVELGRWIEALDRYQAAAQFKLTPDAPQAYHRAQREAAEEGARLQQQVPHLEIRVTPADRAPAPEVHLDGKLVPPVLLNVERLVDPGEHSIEVLRAGVSIAAQRLTVVAGEHKLYTFDNAEAPPPSAPPPPALLVSAPAPLAEQPPTEAPRWLMPVAFGVGGVASAAAIYTGWRAVSAKQTLDETCTPACPSSMQDTLSSYRTYRTTFYVSAAVGLVGLGVGSYFALQPTAAEDQPQLLLTLHSVSLTGKF